jgi:hypothetical protein
MKPVPHMVSGIFSATLRMIARKVLHLWNPWSMHKFYCFFLKHAIKGAKYFIKDNSSKHIEKFLVNKQKCGVAPALA